MTTTSKNNTGSNVDDSYRGRSAGSQSHGNIGDAVRGVAEVIHGVGENIRGTALGALDTITRSPSRENDEIAERGRLETQRGLEKIQSRSHPSESHIPAASSHPTQSASEINTFTTSSGATGSNKVDITGGTPALNAIHGTEAGFKGNPEISHDEYGRDPTYTAGQTRATGSTGAQYPLGAGAEPYGATGSKAAIQVGQKPYPTTRRFGDAGDASSSAPGTAGSESTVYPAHHREDAVGGFPQNQLQEVQQAAPRQTASGLPYNSAKNSGVGSGL